jgi:hypothetical protein
LLERKHVSGFIEEEIVVRKKGTFKIDGNPTQESKNKIIHLHGPFSDCSFSF